MKIKFIYSFLIISILVLYSCSSSSTNNALTFLFDGVPSTDTLKSANGLVVKSDSLSNSNQNNNKPIAPIYVSHEPYKEKMCESCHDINVSFKKTMDLPELCYQCHDDFKSIYKNLHYPVETGECNSCHHPHQAKLARLLLKPLGELCGECHDLDELRVGDVHSGISETDCTECHNPHGSNESSLLK